MPKVPESRPQIRVELTDAQIKRLLGLVRKEARRKGYGAVFHSDDTGQWPSSLITLRPIARKLQQCLDDKDKAFRVVVHPHCLPWIGLGDEAHKVCPECDVRWCEPSPLCPKLNTNRHPVA